LKAVALVFDDEEDTVGDIDSSTFLRREKVPNDGVSLDVEEPRLKSDLALIALLLALGEEATLLSRCSFLDSFGAAQLTSHMLR
jgi:hypothetical protein